MFELVEPISNSEFVASQYYRTESDLSLTALHGWHLIVCVVYAYYANRVTLCVSFRSRRLSDSAIWFVIIIIIIIISVLIPNCRLTSTPNKHTKRYATTQQKARYLADSTKSISIQTAISLALDVAHALIYMQVCVNGVFSSINETTNELCLVSAVADAADSASRFEERQRLPARKRVRHHLCNHESDSHMLMRKQCSVLTPRIVYRLRRSR